MALPEEGVFLVQQNGAVFVMRVIRETSEPFIVRHWYRTTITEEAITRYGLDNFAPLTACGGGEYKITDRPTLRFALPEGGATKAESTSRVSAEGPDPKKVRRRETRWHLGRWEVLSKRDGWVAL